MFPPSPSSIHAQFTKLTTKTNHKILVKQCEQPNMDQSNKEKYHMSK